MSGGIAAAESMHKLVCSRSCVIGRPVITHHSHADQPAERFLLCISGEGLLQQGRCGTDFMLGHLHGSRHLVKSQSAIRMILVLSALGRG